MYNMIAINEDTNVTLPVPKNGNKAINNTCFYSIGEQVWMDGEQKETCGFVKATVFGTPPYFSSQGLVQP